MSMRLLQLCLFLTLLLPSKLYGYSIRIHGDMSEEAYKQSILSNYLPTIGLRADQNINGRTPAEWVIEGSVREDDKIRFLNHFYDPTTGNGLSLGGLLLGEDAINWALELRTLGIGTITQTWSIPDARNYFYTALTHFNEDVRSFNFANTFRALGQVIHLIQDMAQPQHVKNEDHFPIPPTHSRYEEDTKKNKDQPVYTGYPTVNFSNYISYWDAMDGRGMSEVTHFNFFPEREPIVCSGMGKDICSGANHAQPTIIRSLGVDELVAVQSLGDGISILGQMKFFPHSFVDPITGETVVNPRVLSESMFDIDLVERYPNEDPVFSQNRFTFSESQKILVKRAVGYSAGLLDYFFRGRLKVIREPGGIRVENVNTEIMDAYTDPATGNPIGSIAIYYDDTNGTRNLLATYNLPGPLLPDEQTPVIPFSPPPDNIAQNRYIVVFRGKLGEEEGAVIGSVPALKIYYVSTRGGVDKIYRMDTDGANPTALYDNPPNDTLMNLAPSPDGRRLAFVSWDPASPARNPPIMLLDLERGAVTPLLDGGGIGVVGIFPSWSPDGTAIAYSRDVGLSSTASYQVFKIDVATGLETQLTTVPDPMNSGYNSQPAWSPDGSTIALSVSATSNNTSPDDCGSGRIIYLIDAAGNWITHLTCTSIAVPRNDDRAPSWSSDGGEIALMRQARGEAYSELYKVDVVTGTVTKLTDADGAITSESIPAWSPMEPVIAVGSDKDGDFDIWLVDPNGGGYLSNLTDASNPEFDGWPAYGLAP